MILEAQTIAAKIEPIEIETKEEYDAVVEMVYNPPKANERMMELLKKYRARKKG